MRLMSDRNITLLYASEGNDRNPDDDLQFMTKFRGSNFTSGYHDLQLGDRGIQVYLELDGHLHKAIGILKKRVSDFERTLREFKITKYGIKVGEPLTKLRGILNGIPQIV